MDAVYCRVDKHVVNLFAGDGFWDDWNKVPSQVRRAFTSFAVRLKANPYEPDLVGHSQIDRRQRFLFEFTAGWIVGWRTSCGAVHVVPSEADRIDVELLLIRRR